MSPTAKIIDGTTLAQRLREEILSATAALKARGRRPCLAAVLIGDDAAAASYARSQARQAQVVGIEHRLVFLDADVAMAAATETIRRCNEDTAVSGVMLHLPVPQQLDAFALQQQIAPAKDVEGVGATNLGLLMMSREALVPCTAAAAFACLRSTGVDLRGKRAVVVGRSVIVGKPLAMLLLAAHATVTQCHTRTRDLADHTRSAEILMVAAGTAGLIGADDVSPGAIVIDVGANRLPVRLPDGTERIQTVGDVRFDEVASRAAYITPVPGGVGPVTVAMLLSNVVAAAQRV